MKIENYDSTDVLINILIKRKKIIIPILLIITTFLFILWGITISKLHEEMPIEKTIINVQIDTLDLTFAIEHIKEFEGFSPTPYQLGNDKHWYIGFGYQMTHKNQFSRIDTIIGDSLLRYVLESKIRIAHKIYKYNNNKLLAIAVLMYRLGEDKLKTYKLHKHLLNHNQDSILIEWSNITSFDTILNHPRIVERCNYEIGLFKN